jgi:hypothetical protein
LWSDKDYRGRSIVLGQGVHNLRDYNFNDDANSGVLYSSVDNAPFAEKYYRVPTRMDKLRQTAGGKRDRHRRRFG